MSLLTEKQHLDLKTAILGYLKNSGLVESALIFQKETSIEPPTVLDTLEKKWSSITRLQKRVKHK